MAEALGAGHTWAHVPLAPITPYNSIIPDSS